jgi:CubicO group peptidase (beta-lactamase class C family)
VLDQAIDRRAFPGAGVAITHHGRLVALKGMGRFTYEPDSTAVGPDTIYDLASVTKVVATTALCMVLHERGTLKLEQPLVELLPEFAMTMGGHDLRRRQVTLRMLLAHCSGLPAYSKLFESAHSRNELIARALEVPLEADPGSRAEYSDIGFILLGEALERLLGTPLDELCRQQVFSRLDLAHLCFNPPEDWKALIPPTVHDLAFRKRVVQGEVHDENAWVMGGISGHAGCFGTALEVAQFAECMLRGGAPLVSRETVTTFTRRELTPAGTSRALGWDTPSQPSQSGQYFSSSAFGHLGYTGTSLWIDPKKHLSVTLLTNRTWPDRGSQLIKQIRPAFHDAVIEALQ